MASQDLGFFLSGEEVHPVDPGGHSAEYRHHHVGCCPPAAHHELLQTTGLLPQKHTHLLIVCGPPTSNCRPVTIVTHH